MRRAFTRITPLAACAFCIPAHGVILYSTGDVNSHTTAPTGAFANSGWIYQGDFVAGVPVSGTAIGPHAFITAAHVDPSVGTVFSYGGGTYNVTGSTVLTNRDLAIVTVNGTLPYWAPIYNESTDGALTGKTVVDMGRGTQRGSEINVTNSTTGASTLRGWGWGPLDSLRRWGTNVITGFAADNTPKEYFTYTFDANGLPDEATISGGDSGGGAFVKSADGTWKLAGVNSGVDANFKFQSTDASSQSGAIFDFRDLYIQDPNDNSMNPPYQLAQNIYGSGSPIPAKAYISNVTDVSSSAFAPYIPHNGDANLDGVVNSADFSALAQHFGMTSGATWADGDFNSDGRVNALDYNILASNFGSVGVVPLGGTAGVQGSAVPEPVSLAMLSLLLITARRARRD